MSGVDDFETPTLLVAMPQVLDPFFFRAVVLLAAHEDGGEGGSLGFVVNRPSQLKVDEVLRELDIEWSGGSEVVAFVGVRCSLRSARCCCLRRPDRPGAGRHHGDRPGCRSHAEHPGAANACPQRTGPDEAAPGPRWLGAWSVDAGGQPQRLADGAGRGIDRVLRRPGGRLVGRPCLTGDRSRHPCRAGPPATATRTSGLSPIVAVRPLAGEAR